MSTCIFGYGIGIGRALALSLLHFFKCNFAIVLETFYTLFFLHESFFCTFDQRKLLAFCDFQVIVIEWIWKCVHALPLRFFRHGFFKFLQVILFFKRISR